jgi:hypothetical protein
MKDFDPGWGESAVCGCLHGKPLGAGDDAELGRYRSVEDIDQPHWSSPNYEYVSMPELDHRIKRRHLGNDRLWPKAEIPKRDL